MAIEEPVRLPDLLPQYRRRMLKDIDLETISRAGFRIVVGYPLPLIEKALFPPLLQELRCRVISLNLNAPIHEEPPRSLKELRQHRQEVATAVRQLSATLGVILIPAPKRWC